MYALGTHNPFKFIQLVARAEIAEQQLAKDEETIDGEAPKPRRRRKAAADTDVGE